MSLIERAVGRLTQQQPPTQPAEPAAEPRAAATVEAAAPVAEGLVERHVAALAASAPTTATATVDAPPRPAAVPRPAAPQRSPQKTVRIQLEAMRARGMVTPDGDQTHIGQEFRVIKRPLLENAFGRGAGTVVNGKRVMVTSAFPGEGKSFCAINLAMSIAAERDHQVLLIDADVARPSVPAELGISADHGLMDCLLDGGLDVTDFVLATNVDTLAVLPAGRRHKHATELLASAAMARLLDQLSQRFPDRVLIFDSPPLLVTTEARVLTGYMGQVVLVVEANRTPRDAVKEALATISGDVVGLVLNKAREADGGGYYGYGGYGYGSA